MSSISSGNTQISVASAADWAREREHLEIVLIQRFNFFIVFFGVILAATATTGSGLMRTTLLVIGLVICMLIAATLRRAYKKFDVSFRQLEVVYVNHPSFVSTVAIGSEGSRREWIAYLIPNVCNWTLAFCMAASVGPFTRDVYTLWIRP